MGASIHALASEHQPPIPADELIAIVTDAKAARAARLAAGERLARIADPRPGVLTLEPTWCFVPAGSFLMGSADDPEAFERERPQHTIDLPAFHIARYPVTNAQWQRFVSQQGYAVRAFWSDEGWAACHAGGWAAPRFWANAAWPGNGPNRPVVGVSWHEANAFCTWLSGELCYRVRLCSETEWEKGARGVDGRIYPSGNDLDPEAYHLFSQVGLHEEDAPAPVGCYPRGTSSVGAEDMVGNTYAWTTSQWGASDLEPAFGYPYDAVDGRETHGGDYFRVVRGGAWCFPPRNARCAYRGKDRPDEALRSVGVRLVCDAPAPRPDEAE